MAKKTKEQIEKEIKLLEKKINNLNNKPIDLNKPTPIGFRYNVK